MTGDRFPECLMILPAPGATRASDHWRQDHNRAVVAWHRASVGAVADVRRSERGILALFAGLDQLAGSWSDRVDPFMVDHVWGPMIDGAAQALNHDLGRLDAGTLSSWLCSLSARVGRDADTGEYMGAGGAATST